MGTFPTVVCWGLQLEWRYWDKIERWTFWTADYPYCGRHFTSARSQFAVGHQARRLQAKPRQSF